MASDLSLEEIKNEQIDLVSIYAENVAALFYIIMQMYMNNFVTRACQVINQYIYKEKENVML